MLEQQVGGRREPGSLCMDKHEDRTRTCIYGKGSSETHTGSLCMDKHEDRTWTCIY